MLHLFFELSYYSPTLFALIIGKGILRKRESLILVSLYSTLTNKYILIFDSLNNKQKYTIGLG